MVIFQRVHEVYDFLLGVAGSEIQSPVTFFILEILYLGEMLVA